MRELNLVSKLEEIEKQKFELSIQELADLVKRILLPLDYNDLEDDTYDEKLWIDLVIKRSEEYKSGKIVGIPWDKALKDIKEKYKEKTYSFVRSILQD